MKRAILWIVGLLALAFVGSGVVGEILGGGILHPTRRALGAALIAQADSVFTHDAASRQEFEVAAPDGVIDAQSRFAKSHLNNGLRNPDR